MSTEIDFFLVNVRATLYHFSMEKKGLLIILSGPSGVGKGTVRKELMKDSSLNLFYSISMTTRPIRPGEVEGRDYYFVSRERFLKEIENDNLLEHAEFVGNFYGTPKDKVEQMRLEGKNVLLEIEVNGTMTVLSKCKDALSIFLVPPSMDALEARIRGRATEDEATIQGRLNKARSEMNLATNYRYVVMNDNVERAAKEIAKIISDNLQ